MHGQANKPPAWATLARWIGKRTWALGFLSLAGGYIAAQLAGEPFNLYAPFNATQSAILQQTATATVILVAISVLARFIGEYGGAD